MRAYGLLSATLRRLAAVAFVLALALRLAMPAGYMLASDGSLAVVPCPSAGAVHAPPPVGNDADEMTAAMPTMSMDHAMHHADTGEHDPARHQDTSCPYATLFAPVLPPDPPQLALNDFPAFAALHVAFVQQLAKPRPAAAPPPSRGPPFLA